ncbi:LysR family transcriptional regulator [Marilutibacter maris]|uniref:LysR family transcriptional regulator n=1 Tax=Marilutibacter maris TaxID=1605891 RepID=A0A2U9T3K2_9GAMM|nr:LysR family transcriptional regulator [Lysobacter maris]AWV07266.1 LysR family transcriptional regulator [Lysobacter maris]
MFTDDIGDDYSHKADRRLPSLQALRCFEAAARLENFSQAAEALHLTHGAISRAVRLLEDDLGVALFQRRNRRVFLTDAGRRLAGAASEGLAVIRQATAELRAGARRSTRRVLSCEPTLLMRWLIPRWPDFTARHPQLDFHLVAGGGPFSFDDGVDLAIRRADFPWPPHYHAEHLFEERTGPVCRPDRAGDWLAGAHASPALQAHAPRLHTRTRPSAWDAWAAATGCALPPAPEQQFEHFYFSLQAAVAGLGVAIGPWHLVRDDLDSGLLTAPLGFVEDGTRYCLLSPAPPSDGSPEAKLLAWLREIA